MVKKELGRKTCLAMQMGKEKGIQNTDEET
jgi:hypothetical protein